MWTAKICCIYFSSHSIDVQRVIRATQILLGNQVLLQDMQKDWGQERLPRFQTYRVKLRKDEGSQDQFPRQGPVRLSQLPWVSCTPSFSQHHGKRWEGPHSQTLQPPSESISPKESCFQAPSTLNDLTDSEASVCQSQATFLVLIFFTPFHFYLS